VPPSFEPRAKSEDISTGETAHLLTELLCKCGESLEADVGSIALELFRRVEIEDEALALVANSLELDHNEAHVILVLSRRCAAKALVNSILGREPLSCCETKL